jgi:hypothetical protein
LNFQKVQWTSDGLNPLPTFSGLQTERFDSNPICRDDNKNHRARMNFGRAEEIRRTAGFDPWPRLSAE